MSDLFTSEVVVEPGTSPLLVDGSAVTQPVSGTVGISGSVAVTGPLTDTQLRATPVPVTTAPLTSNSATITQVVASTGVNVTLLAANANRKKAILYFPKGTATSYLKFGAAASATSFTYLISANGTTVEIPMWVGQIDFNGAAQTVTVTEMI